MAVPATVPPNLLPRPSPLEMPELRRRGTFPRVTAFVCSRRGGVANLDCSRHPVAPPGACGRLRCGVWGLSLEWEYGGFWKVLMNKGPSGGDLALCARGAAPAGTRRGSRGAGSLPAGRPQEHRVSGDFWAGVCGRGARGPQGTGGGLRTQGGCPHRSSALRGGRASPDSWGTAPHPGRAA